MINIRRFLKPLALGAVFISKASNKIWQELQKSLFAECGSHVVIGRGGTFTHSHIHIGSHVHIGERAAFIAAISHIRIGNHVMVGPDVVIRGGNHRTDVVGEYMINIKDKLPENDRDVVIEDDVWIGCNAIILSGVTIGEGSIIGAGSIVTKDVPPYTVLVGVSERKSWARWDEETIVRHRILLSEKYQQPNLP